MNIKALILCGGLGTRLRPITNTIPKPLIKVGKKPVIDHIIDMLHKYEIDNIAVNIHWLPDQIMKHLGTKVVYFYEPKLLGTAGTILQWMPWLGNDFLVINGDTLTDIDLEDFYNFHIKWMEPATISRDRMNDKCTGAMMFNKKIRHILPKEGMIDDVLDDILTANYYKCPNYWDMGTPAGLEKARKAYEQKTNH